MSGQARIILDQVRLIYYRRNTFCLRNCMLHELTKDTEREREKLFEFALKVKWLVLLSESTKKCLKLIQNNSLNEMAKTADEMVPSPTSSSICTI